MRLTINMMTRGRPQQLLETVKHTLPNMSRMNTRLLISVDNDDEPVLECLKRLPQDDRITVSVKPREDSRGEKYDRALTEAPADIYLPCVDCAPILTPAFDQVIVNAAELFPDGIGCVCTPMANMSFPSLQAPTAGLVAVLGHIYNHDYPFWFIDHELDDICRMTGAYAFVDLNVSTAPMRPSKTIRLRDLYFWTTFFDVATIRRRQAAAKVIDALDIPDVEKRKRKTWYPPVESRSLWLNRQVRDDRVNIENSRGDPGPPDEGYVRAFTKAQAKYREMVVEVQAFFKDAA